MLQEARSEAPGQFKPTTLREEMLSARSDSRRAHNENIYYVIPVTGAAIDGRPFAEGKASSYKEIAPGVFVPFTVAGITMKDAKHGGPEVVVAVNPHDSVYVPMLVHHTGAAVVRITVESINATHGVSEQQRAEPLYLVLALNNADVVADLAYSVSDKSCNGTNIPVHMMAAALKGEDLSDIAWGHARATEAFEAAVRKGLCRGTQVPGILNPILVAHEQKVRAHSKKLWAGQAARTWADVARRAPQARARPSRAAAARPSRVQPSRARSSRAAPVQDSDASSDASSDAPPSSAASADSDATPKEQGTSKRGFKKSGRKGKNKARVRRG